MLLSAGIQIEIHSTESPSPCPCCQRVVGGGIEIESQASFTWPSGLCKPRCTQFRDCKNPSQGQK